MQRYMHGALSVDIEGRSAVVFSDMAEDLISRERAAELLGVGTRQLLRYVDYGWLTKGRNSITGRVCYSRSQVLRLKRNRERFEPPEALAG